LTDALAATAKSLEQGNAFYGNKEGQIKELMYPKMTDKRNTLIDRALTRIDDLAEMWNAKKYQKLGTEPSESGGSSVTAYYFKDKPDFNKVATMRARNRKHSRLLQKIKTKIEKSDTMPEVQGSGVIGYIDLFKERLRTLNKMNSEI
jgi:hypothetical protein